MDYNPPEVVQFYVDDKPELQDQYTGKGDVGRIDAMAAFREVLAEQKIDIDATKEEEEEKSEEEDNGGLHVYSIKLQNVGGCPMPVCFEVLLADGSRQVHRLPAEIWIKNKDTFIAELRLDQEIEALLLDPYAETPDINLENNHYPFEYRGEPIGRFGAESGD